MVLVFQKSRGYPYLLDSQTVPPNRLTGERIPEYFPRIHNIHNFNILSKIIKKKFGFLK